MSGAPLRRNRDFLLLQAGQLASTTGSLSTTVAYPLLVLSLTHSPPLAGFVTFARTMPTVLCGPVAGVLIDRFDRRSLMVAADAFRMAAIGGLAVLVVTTVAAYWQVLTVAVVEGTFSALFTPAALAALRAVVPPEQLPDAVSTQQGRSAVASLAGPSVGGSLFGLGRALPFLADVASYVLSVVSVLAMRGPFQEDRVRDGTRMRAQLAEGWRFLWRQPFLRTTTFLYGLTNIVGPGVMLAIVVVGRRQGLASDRIGLLLAASGGCVLIGAFVSPLARRVLSRRGTLLLELWAWPGPLLFLVWPNAYVLAASILPAALAVPLTDSVVISYRLAMTPDRLVGRVESVRANISYGMTPFGSLIAGLLLGAASARVTAAFLGGVGLALAVWGTLSPAIRDAPAGPARSHG